MEPLGRYANYGAAELARVTDTPLRTARRWIKTGLAPRLAVRFLELLDLGPLGTLCREWEGWHLWRGKLCSPEHDEYSPGEVRAIALQHQRIAALEREVRELEQRLAQRPADAESDHEPRPQRQQPRARGRDFFDDLGAVSREHLATLLETAASIARRQSTAAPSHDDAPFSSLFCEPIEPRPAEARGLPLLRAALQSARTPPRSDTPPAP